MAINIGAVTTWAMLKTRIRRKSGTMSEQLSGLIDVQLTDLINTGLLVIRQQFSSDPNFINFYIRPDAVTLSAVSASGISTGSIAATSTLFNINSLDFGNLSLSATLTGGFTVIPLFKRALYDQYKRDYSVARLGTKGAVGTVYLTSATPNVLTIEIYTGATAASTPTTPLFSYPKNPKEWVADADTVDMPDNFIPAVEDYCVKAIEGMPQIKRSPVVTQEQQ